MTSGVYLIRLIGKGEQLNSGKPPRVGLQNAVLLCQSGLS